MAPGSSRTVMKCKKVEERMQKKKSMARSSATLSTTTSSYSSSSSGTKEVKGEDDHNEEDICSTPKGKRFRIPEVSTCPPAPKKRRVSTCSSKKSPIAFFSSPDMENFFFSAIKTVTASTFTPSGV
ncbi:hypothetical protein LR48_Vigan02g037300 [Vigna angularis]|uniref:Cyclin-dependent protein kinase inhibitor SMR13 n=2 Tax=Phaseolus angularis TaxID=3914 RepID=A0A0L9TUF4_PHAAN|nr:cyclin-dependent protein kinase inhibitor SMR9 [Vigna angularis]KOM34223.1 hypothetical protein LR48_Vigan02g037300 [Vigna angularis]BAT96382.1 hypothetical protein VIGAN_08331300 [Vigna angularis var. angularis]